MFITIDVKMFITIDVNDITCLIYVGHLCKQLYQVCMCVHGKCLNLCICSLLINKHVFYGV